MSPATKPTHADVAVEPVQCPKAPILRPDSAAPTRAGHYYQRIDGIWTCANCQEPRP